MSEYYSQSVLKLTGYNVSLKANKCFRIKKKYLVIKRNEATKLENLVIVW